VLYAISMVKDEVDIIADTLRHLASEGVEGIVIADNLSTDGTWDLLHDMRSELDLEYLLTRDTEPAYYQSRKMTALARTAVARGASWIVPFDADELWYAPQWTLAADLAARASDVNVVEAELYDYVATGLDPAGIMPFQRLRYRRPVPAPLRKVAFRARRDVVVQAGNHDVTMPAIKRQSGLTIAHFPYRSAEQMVRKAVNGAAAYALTDLPDYQGAHWRQYGSLVDHGGPLVLHGVFQQYFFEADPVDAGLQLLPAPFCRWAGRDLEHF
jgi:glycosyltransferase involved in cell wall biosynthesis